MTLEQKLKDAVWIAHSLFERGKTSGSSANLSFLHDGRIYITASGTCFGTLTSDDFAVVSLLGERLNSLKPSKELTLHRYYYEHDESVQAVIHTHGPNAVLWSCRKFAANTEIIPPYTPYLGMKVGPVRTSFLRRLRKTSTQEMLIFSKTMVLSLAEKALWMLFSA